MAEISDIELEKAIDEVLKLNQDTGTITSHGDFFGGIINELQQKGFENSTIDKKLDNYINKNIDHSFFNNEFNILDIPDVRTKVNKLNNKQLYDEFITYLKITSEAEKPNDKITQNLLNQMPDADWKEFSKARGYSPEEIKDFERYLELANEMEKRFPGKGDKASLAEQINFQYRVEDMKDGFVTIDEHRKFIDTPLPNENVIDFREKQLAYQDTSPTGRPLAIKNNVPVDINGNPIKPIGAADETITIYRVVPEGVDTINSNDWVFINKNQAEEGLKNANKNSDGKFNLIEMEVSRGDVYVSKRGNLEMGYFPKDTPTNVVDFREKQLQKLMEEVEAATPDVTKITSSQAEMIDNALADAAANLRRGTFEALPGGKGALTKAIKTRLVSILGDGLNVLDVYELGLLLGAVGQPALDPIVKIIFPDAPDDNRPYKERVLENIQRVEKISPTAGAVKKISEAMPEPVDREYTIYGVPSNRKVQFTSMYGMLGGNNGEK